MENHVRRGIAVIYNVFHTKIFEFFFLKLFFRNYWILCLLLVCEKNLQRCQSWLNIVFVRNKKSQEQFVYEEEIIIIDQIACDKKDFGMRSDFDLFWRIALPVWQLLIFLCVFYFLSSLLYTLGRGKNLTVRNLMYLQLIF